MLVTRKQSQPQQGLQLLRRCLCRELEVAGVIVGTGCASNAKEAQSRKSVILQVGHEALPGGRGAVVVSSTVTPDVIGFQHVLTKKSGNHPGLLSAS